ncbi:MAG: HK97 family phage prohead protease [Henriciella sp.]|uniref:HK97 family phage prohead protease n=1 Tax=Henriciella sp. TaxID=1968823 RepID=UPI0032EC5E31
MDRAPVLIEGHAALFGVEDLSGDVVRAGAFARSLSRGGVPMLLQHRSGAVAGRWTRLIEDGRGLFVRGLIERPGAQVLVEVGLNGLSIGFRARLWKPRVEGGRDLIDLDLVEISLVAEPMQPGARFSIIGAAARAA